MTRGRVTDPDPSPVPATLQELPVTADVSGTELNSSHAPSHLILQSLEARGKQRRWLLQ